VSVVSSCRLLPFLLLAAGCVETASAPGSAGPRPQLDEEDLWSMVPAEADLVLWADMAKLRASPWTRDSFQKVTGDKAGAEPAFDHIRDVDRLVFAKVPALRDGASVLVAQGKIDRDQMAKAFSPGQEAGERSVYRGAEILVRGEEALAFLGKRTVLSGPTIAVRAATDCNFGLARVIESEDWFRRMRADLLRGKEAASLVTALYVRLQPATREALMREMGEGGTLEEFAARVDLGEDLNVSAIGAVRTQAEARDLAGRLSERIRDARVRPIVAAFGFASVLDSVQFQAKGNRAYGSVHVSAKERVEIAERMAAVADMMAKLRKTEKEKQP
jgi:hypothetical protein